MPGGLILVVGGSGVGKDTLLNMLRADFADDPHIVFARRIITRAAHVAVEDHDTMDEAAFTVAEAAGAFALSWRANGLAYALPAQIKTELASGKTVIANISRDSLKAAEALCDRVAVLHVTASVETRARRLATRGRESEEALRARLSREVPLATAAPIFRIANDGALEDAARELRAAMRRILER